MIDRVRLSAQARNQLITLKRRTGIEHYNTLGRHALCMSLAHPAPPTDENHNLANGLEIDWRTFTGGHETLYLNLLIHRATKDGLPIDELTLKNFLSLHVHRGLSFLMSLDNSAGQEALAMHVLTKTSPLAL